MSDESAFLKRIVAEPSADGPRLVYADWLDDRGDPRGEFIRLQCALARLPIDDPAREGLTRREKQLTARHARDWAAGLAGKATRCTFRRGFVDAITLTARQFLEHGEPLLAGGPVRVVRLTDVRDAIDELACCTTLARVAEIDLSGNDLGDDAIDRLIAAGAVNGARAILMGANALTDRTVARLAVAALPRLSRLDLSYNHVREPGALAQRTTLIDLDLGYNEITEPGILTKRRWGRLVVTGNPIGDGGAARLFRTPGLLESGRLELTRCELTPASLTALLARPDLDRLTTLLLAENDFGDSGAATLADAPAPALSVLSLACNGITDPGAAALIRGRVFPQLRRLDLRGNRLSPAGAAAIWNSPHRGPELRLELTDNIPPPRDLADGRDDLPPVRLSE